MMTRIYRCGCCGCFHREDFDGDCRNDPERCATPEIAADRFGSPVIEVIYDEFGVEQESVPCSLDEHDLKNLEN